MAGFLGMPRREKGFDLLSAAVRLLGEETRNGALCFRLQAPAAYLEREGMSQVLGDLRTLADSGHAIECIGEDLDSEGYQALLQSCDFLVIPYRTETYARRSSLVPIEGLLYGKPLVMTAGLMVTASLPPDAGVVEFPDGDVVVLAMAIREMLANYSFHAAKAREIDPAWRGRHTPEGFVLTLHEWAGARTSEGPVPSCA